MMTMLRIAMAQLNPLVGDIDGNTDVVLASVEQAVKQHQADIVLFPELMLTGYPPEDLLLRPSLAGRIERALQRLLDAIGDVIVVVGYPMVVEHDLYNAAGVIYQHGCIAQYRKQYLPNYKVFDEKRYFVAGDECCILTVRGIPIALTICEDVWHAAPVAQAAAQGAQLILTINASPFHEEKVAQRQALLKQRVSESGLPMIYVNMVGGQDELVFDGGSMAIDGDGELQVVAPYYETGLFLVEVESDDHICRVMAGEQAPPLSRYASLYQALVLGARDYVNKNGFQGVILGLSGGIDSALTLAIACDALGADRVQTVMMPFRYTTDASVEDAQQQAQTLQVKYDVISIEPIYDAFMASLAEAFAGADVDTTEQNIQARCRGTLLMALSNKKGWMVLTTGNKSEIAVGYTTLYGDMAGGFDVLKDVSKTSVYALARYRNTRSPVIPERVITRPPSAELAPDQLDEDHLPPYDILDAILEHYIEYDHSATSIVAEGFDAATVRQVIQMVDRNEYKRRQAPVGPRVTPRGFGRDRRYPISSGWLQGN